MTDITVQIPRDLVDAYFCRGPETRLKAYVSMRNLVTAVVEMEMGWEASNWFAQFCRTMPHLAGGCVYARADLDPPFPVQVIAETLEELEDSLKRQRAEEHDKLSRGIPVYEQ